jgi:tetratricopeptide (TPR) repeat protein
MASRRASLAGLVRAAGQWYASLRPLARALLATAGGIAFLAGIFAVLYLAFTYEGPVSREDAAHFRVLFMAAAEEEEDGGPACAALTAFLEAHPEVAGKVRYVRSVLRTEDDLSADASQRVKHGDYQGALSTYQELISVIEEFDSDWAACALYGHRLGTAGTLVKIARIHLLMGDAEAAGAAFTRALASRTDAPLDDYIEWEIKAVKMNPRDPPNALELKYGSLKRKHGLSP